MDATNAHLIVVAADAVNQVAAVAFMPEDASILASVMQERTAAAKLENAIAKAVILDPSASIRTSKGCNQIGISGRASNVC